MTLTRAKTEAVLVRRVGTWYTAAGLDGTTKTGDNDDLNDPIGAALLRLGYSVADIAAVADADVALVATADVSALLDLAELRALETASQAMSTQEVAGLGYKVRTDSRIDAAIDRLRAAIAQRYGIGAGGTLSGGAVSLDFQETGVTG